ncbi:MAG: response regulator transcription factor [Phycisphaerales bacterium]|nr:response regulator transcription factor [Phycisphaerales bacterium]
MPGAGPGVGTKYHCTMRILVVEDSEVLRESLVDGLTQAGHAVDAVADGRQAMIHAQTTDYDLVVLDLMIPEIDGLTVLRQLRAKRWDAHVLILSARDRIEQRVEGLRAGADDYLVKPFAFAELLARVETLGRRAHGRKTSELDVGAFTLDLAARTVTVGEVRVDLTPREFAVLSCLTLQAGRPVRRAKIEETVYDEASAVWSNAIDSLVSSIRRKLAAAGCTRAIVTRRGVGYEVPIGRGTET